MRSGPRVRPGTIALRVLAAGVLVYLAVPAFIVVPMSIGEGGMLEFPPRGFSFVHYWTYLTDPAWQRSTALSFRIALPAALVATLFGTAAAMAVHRLTGRARRGLSLVMTLPKFVPSIVTAIALYGFFITIGLAQSELGLVIAHSMIGVPLVFLAVLGSLSSTHESLEKAAMSLGARPWRAVWHVTLPLVRPAVATGAIFAFVTSFDEVVIALFLSGPGRTTLPVKMFESLEFALDPVIAAVSTLLILLSVAMLIVLRWVRKRLGGPDALPVGEVPRGA